MSATRPRLITDMGWGPRYGPFNFTLLPEAALSSELARLSGSTTISGVHCVTFQPCPNPDQRSQDRYIVQDWQLQDGVWKFLAVFDGHAGHETGDYAAEQLPSRIKSALSALQHSSSPICPFAIAEVLEQSIASFDDSIKDAITNLFPSGVEGLSEQEIRTIINDGGENSARVARGMQGTTALVALLDPTRTNLWVASLGDCQAVLGTKESSGAWTTSILSSFHNGGDTEETARIRREHPGELECISHDRVLGAVAVTRALGDLTFKLPPAYTTRVFLNSDTPFLFRSDVHNWIRHNHTPPYLSNVAEVRHVPLRTTQPQFLIMCSDGLLDLYRGRHSWMAEKARTWVDVVGGAMMERREMGKENLALRLLRHALGGEQRQLVSRMITVEMTDRWMDDTTILVLPL